MTLRDYDPRGGHVTYRKDPDRLPIDAEDEAQRDPPWLIWVTMFVFPSIVGLIFALYVRPF
jgi:hypothetical protein